MIGVGDKRKFVRFDIPLAIMFREMGQENAYHQAVASNFSREGLCMIAADFPFEPKSMIEVKLNVPEREVPLVISGEVMWRSHSSERWQIGLRFRDIDRVGKMDVLDYAYNSWLSKIRSQPR